MAFSLRSAIEVEERIAKLESEVAQLRSDNTRLPVPGNYIPGGHLPDNCIPCNYILIKLGNFRVEFRFGGSSATKNARSFGVLNIATCLYFSGMIALITFILIRGAEHGFK